MRDLLVEEIELREQVIEVANELGLVNLSEALANYRSEADSWTTSLAADLQAEGISTKGDRNLQIAGLAVALGCLVDRIDRIRAATAARVVETPAGEA
jgi:hypothetical protein